LEEFDLLFSVRGVIYIFLTGILGIQSKIINDQKKKINTYENNLSNIEPLLRAILERKETPQDIKELAQETLNRLKPVDE